MTEKDFELTIHADTGDAVGEVGDLIAISAQLRAALNDTSASATHAAVGVSGLEAKITSAIGQLAASFSAIE